MIVHDMLLLVAIAAGVMILNLVVQLSLVTSSIDYQRMRIHYNSLVQYNEKLLPQPELAEEFSSNDALTEWTFKIRKDVAFHDGSKLSADDVVWSMRRHMGDDSKSVVKPLVAGVKEWKKVDSHTVKAILYAADIDFPRF